MIIYARMKDGTMREYNINLEIPYADAIMLAKMEIPDARCILIKVPPIEEEYHDQVA